MAREADLPPMPGKVAGVLGLQGDLPEHARIAAGLLGGDRVRAVRSPDDLRQVSALLLPGGESTTLSRLLDEARLREPLLRRIAEGLPVLGTCAGLILLAKDVERSPRGRDPVPLGVLDVGVRRNDYGRQVDSFETSLRVDGLSEEVPAAFIRAPRILRVGRSVQVLARVGEDPVMVRHDTLWGLTFHPEISEDPRVHRWFFQEAGLMGN